MAAHDADSEPTSGSQQAPDSPGALGAQLAGHFELLQEIGSGSSGTVYHARLTVDYGELSRGDEVAVKFLRPELAADQRARARMFAEGELGQSLRHPNVAEIYGVETIQLLGSDTTYLIMQYVRGTTLRDLVRRSGPPVEDLTRRLGADAAKGLFALHRRGLAHRDIKPENLILTPDSELKIVDLGLASPFGSEVGGSSPPVGSSSGSVFGSGGSATHGSAGRSSGVGLAGSVAYSAPETLRGRSAGPKSDLYALGIVLFEVTTGQHPFANATSADEMLHAHLYRLPPLPSHLRARVSPFLEQVLLDLLQKNPDDRPRSAAEVARLLEQGERSDWWRKHEAKAPVLESSRRLLRMRRPAEAAFVGRRDEISSLDEALQSARAGRGRVVAITGPEGIGRRRLCDEAMQRWLDRDEPPRYLGGEADSGLGHGEPFATAMLDHLLRGDDRNSPNARQRAIEQAREQFALDATAAEALVAVTFGDSTEPSEVRADRLASALLALPTKQRVLVLRVDHADDLDTSGRLVLQRLCAEAAQRHLLVLLAAGPDTTLIDAAQEPIQQRIDLAGLDEREFRSFARTLFRDEQHGAALDAFLVDAHVVLSGLPGSLLEMLDHLTQEGQLHGRVGDYHGLVEGLEPRPAPSYVERFRERVRSFDEAHRRVLSAAAVLGERCTLADLSALVERSELSVLETLSLFRGRVVRAQGGEVSFRHRDFRRALLLQLPPAEQQQLHLRAAELFEAQGARPLIVGMHRSQALDHEGCLDPLLAALQNRVHAGSRRTALRLVGRLAVHFRHVTSTARNERRRLRFLVLSAQAQQNADQNDAASRTFRTAERLARSLEDLEASAAARIGVATVELDQGRLLSSIALLETVHDDLTLAGLDAQHAPELDALAAQAHALHGRILLYLGQASDSLKHLQAAKKRVPAEQEDLRCHLWIDLARTEALSHRYATALRTLREIEKLPPVRQQPRARLRFHLYRGYVRGLCGDDQAHQDLRLALDEALRLALPVYGSRAAVFLGELYFLRGRDDDALQRYQQAVLLAKAAGDRLGGAVARAMLVRLGHPDPELAELVHELDLPEVHASWWLALLDRARHDVAADLPVDLTERFEQMLANADLPLPLHLRVLAWLERPASSRSLVRSISQRFPERALRQQFQSMWARGARI